MDIMNMETFYDIGSSDLKDIWESDLDPSESLKLSADTDMQDWFLERDVKIPPVILHDKLMSDALLGTLPIKTEHSYSLNSDGDSMPDSPGSLQNKMDDMDDECYPAISMNTATSNSRRLIDTTTQLNSIHTTPSSINSIVTTTNIINNNINNTTSCLLNSIQTTCIGSINQSSIQNSINPFNLRSKQQHQHLPHQQQLPQMSNSTAATIDQIYNCSGNSSSASSMSSDIDIDDSCIKDEPMSPADDSSCPPSPININSSSYNNGSNNNNNNGCGNSGISLNMAKMAAITNTDLVFEHKLSPASQSLLKSQQITLPNGTTTSTSSITTSPQRIILPKVNIKMESQINHQQQQQQQLFGLPPTPPSSLPSDDSEGNQSPDHILLSPLSPSGQQLMSAAGSSGINSPASSPTGSGSTRRTHGGGSGGGNGNNNMTSSTTSTSSTSSSSSGSGGNSSMHNNSSSSAGIAGGRGGYTGTSTRQPIHTPLISSQPKGSTGTLILTEEEKRTLLAEGYPIPTRLPLTKAEEKSLKKIRRKIKNKISAQESRRKKKEYMDQLERKVEILVSENSDYRKRVESLEDSNTSLLNQLQKLQALVNRQKK